MRDLTAEEERIIQMVGDAVVLANALPVVHKSDMEEMAQAVHVIQNIIYARPGYEAAKAKWSASTKVYPKRPDGWRHPRGIPDDGYHGLAVWCYRSKKRGKRDAGHNMFDTELGPTCSHCGGALYYTKQDYFDAIEA